MANPYDILDGNESPTQAFHTLLEKLLPGTKSKIIAAIMLTTESGTILYLNHLPPRRCFL